jgi:hypothetical protein
MDSCSGVSAIRLNIGELTGIFNLLRQSYWEGVLHATTGVALCV